MTSGRTAGVSGTRDQKRLLTPFTPKKDHFLAIRNRATFTGVGRDAILEDPQIKAKLEAWKPSFEEGIRACDVEVERVFETSENFTETLECIHKWGNRAMLVTGVAGIVRQGVKVAAAKGGTALLKWTAKTGATALGTLAAREAAEKGLERLGFDEGQRRAVMVGLDMLAMYANYRMAKARAAKATKPAAPSKGMTQARSSFNYGKKIQQQAGRRGWSDSMIDDTISQPHATSAATNKATGGSATAYFRNDGSYVVRDNASGTIIQVSDRMDPTWIPDSTIQNPYRPK